MSVSQRWKLLSALILIIVSVAGTGSYLISNKPTKPYTTSLIPTATVTSLSLPSSTISSTSAQTSTPMVTTAASISESLFRLESSGNALNIQFARELRKLPDLSNAISATKNVDTRMAEAVESMVNVVLSADDSQRNAIGMMLKEGIPEKRKFCTPLQAWLWVAYDIPDYNPLTGYSLDSLLYDAWLGTTTSNRFNSSRWTYAEAKDRVNSPEIVNWFIFQYLTFDMARGSVHPQNDEITYKVRRGVCRHAAYLATEFLTHNGYEAKDVTFSPARNQGHTVGAVKLGDGIWVVVDFRCTACYLPMQGPFGSYMDVAHYVADSLGYKTTFFIGIEDNYEIMERNNDLP